MSDPKTILITGATGGIGSALADVYAGSGQTLILFGRDRSRLQQVADRCRHAGAHVETESIDVRDTDALRERLDQISERFPPDMVIVNAGIIGDIGADAEGESWEAIERIVQVNLTAALATADAVLPAMRRRGSGQIVFISSMSAYFGLPLTPTYAATKAALKSYAEGWRGWLAPERIGVTAVMPGFVESDMSRQFPGPRPFLITAERSATIIKRRLRRNPARISFPFPLNFGMWWLAVLPPAVSLRILGVLGYVPHGNESNSRQ
ncbi:MAG: SDR family NAD(P)-dependent oxidoreductase [Gammaproteobacteria bacterium]|nr:SDR family NAD(P)-dependent oxidoreductase [Gammaproteobacteria bacterium]